MPTFLAIQNTYTHLQMALFHGAHCLGATQLDKTVASKECILSLQELLNDHNLKFENLDFIAANQGPGPFTTLRVVIATINGLSFATKIPLIGINSLDALLSEFANHPAANKVVMLNAFGRDVYYLIQTNTTSVNSGCGALASVILEITTKIPHDPILFLGNGFLLNQELLQATFGNRAIVLEPFPETASLKQVALIGLEHWNKQENISYQLQPFYYKAAMYNA